MDGLLNKIKEYSKPVNYSELIDLSELKKWLEQESKNALIEAKKKAAIWKHNLKCLREKSEELGKPIPDELIVVLYLQTPVGYKFFEKYKEWL